MNAPLTNCMKRHDRKTLERAKSLAPRMTARLSEICHADCPWNAEDVLFVALMNGLETFEERCNAFDARQTAEATP